jgi:hypothetical protein
MRQAFMAGPAKLVRGSSRRITTMMASPGTRSTNIRVINRRRLLPRLLPLCAWPSQKAKDHYDLTGHSISGVRIRDTGLLNQDGKVLAAAAVASPLQNPPNVSVNVYSLPTGTLTNTFPLDSSAPVEISLSGAGNWLGIGGGVISLTGGTLYGTSGYAVEFSPDGTLVAAPSGGNIPTTTIYTNGALTTAVNGGAVGWLDNARLLVDNFKYEDENGIPFYDGTTIFSPSGTNLGSAPIPQIQSFQVVSSDSIYSPQTHTIFSVTTGATTWMSADESCSGVSAGACIVAGAVSGTQVIFAIGNLVLAQPY